MTSWPRKLIVVLSLLLAQVALAQSGPGPFDLEARRRTDADIDACSANASREALAMLYLNPNWRRAYNQCLRQRLNLHGRRANTAVVERNNLYVACEAQRNPELDDLTEFNLVLMHGMNRASDQILTRHRTSRDMQEELFYYHKTRLEAEAEARVFRSRLDRERRTYRR